MSDTTTTTPQATDIDGNKKPVDPNCCTVPPGDPGPST